jgi:hypothetical protein
MAAFQFYLQSGKRKSRGGWGTTAMLFLVRNSLVTVRRRDAEHERKEPLLTEQVL